MSSERAGFSERGDRCACPWARRVKFGMAVIAVGVILLGPTAGPAATAGASTTVLPAIDTLFQIFRDDGFKGPAAVYERRQALRAVMERFIDFPDIAQRALGPQWQARTERERREFVRIFEDLVTNVYVATMQVRAARGVTLVAERQDDGLATVVTKVDNGEGRASSVEYRMHRRADRWLAHDIFVDGVSFVGNYRTQFNSVLRTSRYADLLRRMREQVTEPPGIRGSPQAAWRAELRQLMFVVVAPSMR